MKSKTVLIDNVARLAEAGEALQRRAYNMPGMGLIHGETGYGKSTAITWWVNKPHVNGVFVRALACWTPASMLEAILRKLGRDPRGSCARMMGEIIEILALSQRPLFIDEADYIVESKRMCESARDLHDMATVPVVLIGMGGIDQRLAHRKQLTGRVMQDVKFQPLTEQDAQKIATELGEVEIRSDLVSQLNRQAAGSVRLLVVGLQRIEQAAKSRGLSAIGAAEWGRREFFTGEAPESGKVAQIRKEAV